jgi:uncharacterized paraquat-inducible protein A
MAVVAAVLLVCIGALLGATWSRRLLERRLHQEADQQAEERRMLAKEWAAIHQRRGECPRCSDPLPGPRRITSRTVSD